MKKKIIAAIILLVLGAAAILAGIFIKPLMPSDDVTALTDEYVGKTVNIRLEESDIFPLPQFDDSKNYVIFDTQKGVLSPDFDNYVCVYVPDGLTDSIDLLTLYKGGLSITGTVKKAPEDLKEESVEAIINYYKWMSDISDAYEYKDEEGEYFRESLSDYCIEIMSTDVETMKLIRTIAYALGALLIFISLVLWISIITRSSAVKVALILIGIMVVLGGILALLFHKHLGTMGNIRKDAKGVYYIEYKEELKLDDMLANNITSDTELFAWLSKSEYYGMCPITVDSSRYGCSSFAAKTAEGDVLFGRNFDFPETDTVMVYTKPQNGYASYGMADLAMIGVGRGSDEIDPDTPPGRFMMTASPYLVMDGVNEAGLGISVLELSDIELHQDTGKPDLFIYTAIRIILDRCATVDEAVNFLEGYDLHAREGASAHLFVADKTGRSVVIEWFGDKMYVNEQNAVTNSVVTPGQGDPSCRRLKILNDTLKAKGNILTKEEARDLLDAAKQANTEWSSIYNLSNFTADVYMDSKFDRAYHYGAR